jgi:polysaccharide biosynthesis protein VpsM
MVIIIMILGFLCSAAIAKTTIAPEVKTTMRYDSNYFRAENNTHGVITYLIQPGFILGYTGAKTLLNLKYSLDANYYSDQQKTIAAGQRSANGDDYLGHTVVLGFRYKPFRRLTLGVDDNFAYTRDPGQSDAFNNTVARDQYITNRILLLMRYDFLPKFTLELKYRNSALEYDPAAVENSRQNRGIASLAYNLNKTLSLALEHQYAQMDYNQTTADYTLNQTKLIIKKSLRTITFEAGAGYHRRDFDQANHGDVSNLTYHLTFSIKPDALTGPHFNINYEANYNDRGTGEAYYLAHRLRAGFKYVGRKLNAGLGGYYQYSDYEFEDRNDHTFDIGVDLGYKITRWIIVSFRAGFENRDSSNAGLDYENAYVLGTIRVGYDFGTQ